MAGLSSTEDIFPLHVWVQLILQATLTLNILRQSQKNPKMASHMALEGAFYYNKTPLAPLGTKVVMYKNNNKRASWAAYGVDAWYLVPEMNHYRCYHVYVTDTRAERNSNTVEFFPHHTKLTDISAINASTTAAQQLVTALSNTKPNTAVEKVGHWQLAALRVLAQIFQHTETTNKPGFEDPKHTAKPRVEASNPRVQKQLLPSSRRSQRIVTQRAALTHTN